MISSDSPYRTAISGAVLKLQEGGVLQGLKTKWWKQMRGGGKLFILECLNYIITVNFKFV